MTRRLWTALRIAIGFALLYVVWSRARAGSAAAHLLSSVWLFPVLGTQTLCGTAIEATRLRILLASQRMAMPFGFAYRLCSVAAFFGLCIPGGTGGDVIKLYYLRERARGKGVEVATVLLIDRALGMFAMLLVLLGMAAFEQGIVRQHASIRILILTAAAAALAMPLGAFVVCSGPARSGRWYRGYVARVGEAVYAFREHRQALAAGFGVSICGHLALATMFVAAGSVAAPGVPPLVTCMLSFLGMFANALPITPGGLGVGESAFQALFATVASPAGAVLLLAWRIGMLFPAVLGCVFYMRGMRGPLLEPAPAVGD